MESRKLISPPPSNQELKNSMTAFSVLLGYWRFMQKHPELFDEKERMMVSQMIPLIKEGFPWSGANGLVLNTIYYSPRSLQSFMLNNIAKMGYDELMGMRKLMIKNWLEECNAEQVVVIGDGYDTRALLYGLSHPNVSVFACDRAPTRDLKLKALMSVCEGGQLMGDGTYLVGENIRYINLDLQDVTLLVCLKAHGFDPNKKTAILLEGVLPYLSDVDVASTMSGIRKLSENHSNVRVLLSVMDKIKYGTATQEQAHKNSGEGLKSSLHPSKTIEKFGSLGFEVTGKFSSFNSFYLINEHETQFFYDVDSVKSDGESMSRELYYELCPSDSPDIQKTLDHVPVLSLPINTAPRDNASWCNLL